MDTQMRIRLDQYQQLRHLLVHDTSVEQGCFLLCSEHKTDDGLLFLVNEIIYLTSDDYLLQEYNILSIKPETMLRIVRLARSKDKSICFIHTHPMSKGNVAFSDADDIGNKRTFEFFNRLLPNKFNTALVFDKTMSVVSGRIYNSSNHWHTLSKIVVAGYPHLLSAINNLTIQKSPIETYSRQALLLGEEGQHRLSNLKIVVVGLGGIGSLTSTMASHSGFKHITLIDPDALEDTNRPRILASSPDDVFNSKLKIDIAADYIKQCWPDCTVVVVDRSTENDKALNKLIEADLIICGTDNAHSRAYLTELSNRYYVPLLDLGVEFITIDGELTNEVGKVNFILPGAPCLWCTNHVTPELIAAEELSDEESKKRAEEGYIKNTHIPQPSMMIYNGEVVSRGLQQVIQHFTGLSEIDPTTYEQFSFIGLNNRKHHRLVKKHQRDYCPFCSIESGVLGHGNTTEKLIKPAA